MAVHLRQIALLRHPKNAKHQHIELLHLVVPLSGGEGARHSPSALVLRDDEQLLLEMARFAPFVTSGIGGCPFWEQPDRYFLKMSQDYGPPHI